MRKADLIKRISINSGFNKYTIEAVLDEFNKEVLGALMNGESIYIRGFGTTSLKFRKPKTGRNITKEVIVDIPARYIPCIKFSKQFIKTLNEQTISTNQ